VDSTYCQEIILDLVQNSYFHEQYRTMWVLSKGNEKTGVCISQYVGLTDDESMESCEGCPLLKTKECYAHFSSHIRMAHMGMIKCKQKENGKSYSLDEVTSDRFFSSVKFVRLGARGDPSRSKEDTNRGIEMAREKGLPVIGYTHFPEEAPEYKGTLLASTSDWDEADRLIAEGWHVSIEYEFPVPGMKSPDGHKAVWCPNESSNGAINCGDCLLCCTDENPNIPIIMFKHKLRLWEKRGKSNGRQVPINCEADGGSSKC